MCCDPARRAERQRQRAEYRALRYEQRECRREMKAARKDERRKMKYDRRVEKLGLDMAAGTSGSSRIAQSSVRSPVSMPSEPSQASESTRSSLRSMAEGEAGKDAPPSYEKAIKGDPERVQPHMEDIASSPSSGSTSALQMEQYTPQGAISQTYRQAPNVRQTLVGLMKDLALYHLGNSRSGRAVQERFVNGGSNHRQQGRY